MTTILGIESTCDETAAALVADGRRVINNVVATQVELHARYRGVVPEIASRAHLENLLPVLIEACGPTGLEAVDAIAVAHRPGLIGSLLIGVTAAKTLAWALNKPLIGVDHVHAHLYSVRLVPPASSSSSSAVPDDPVRFPAIGLVVSGGHTALYAMDSFEQARLVGSTLDDAVGEAYDKVSAILGLGYPGGPVIDRLAADGDPAAIRFPRTLLSRQSLDFSFSGLKTSVLYRVRGHQGRQRGPESLDSGQIRDVAAGFQAACIDVLVKKLRRAVRQFAARSVIVGGGVSSNRGLRLALADFEVPVHLPSPVYCTDNAAMIAGLAHLSFVAGRFSQLNLDAITNSQFAEHTIV